jgi:hypothetical protein
MVACYICSQQLTTNYSTQTHALLNLFTPFLYLEATIERYVREDECIPAYALFVDKVATRDLIGQ